MICAVTIKRTVTMWLSPFGGLQRVVNELPSTENDEK
jgi:hypothetical protein